MSKPQPQRDPLSCLAREVLALFASELSEVRFPDLDLSRLEAAADGLRMSQLQAERIEAELETARRAVAAESEAFTVQAQRALAYARVFAEADPALASRVAEIGDPRSSSSARGAEPKKRGRPRKLEGDVSLFGSVSDSGFEATSSAGQAAE